jgi:cyanophycinase
VRRSRPLTLTCAAALALPLLALPAQGADPDAPATLVPVGGGYEPATLRSFGARVAAQATGDTVDIYVVPSAYGDAPEDRDENLLLAQERTDQVEQYCDEVVDLTEFPGGCEATLLVLLDRADALDPARSAPLADPDADGVYVLGGDQVLAMQVLANSPAEVNLGAAFHNGVVVGGTSAGNAVESRTMGAGYPDKGYPWNALERDMSLVFWGDDLASDERGLSFGSQEIILDQHFYERGRFGRLLSWTAQSVERYGSGGKLGVGVDWATGVVIEDDTTVTDPFGYSSSTVIDLSRGERPRWVGERETLSVRGALTHLLAPGRGMSYDVPSRTASLGGEPVPAPVRQDLPALVTKGNGALWLGGGWNDDAGSAALAELVAAARPGGRGKAALLVVAAGYETGGDAREEAASYEAAVRDLGWAGEVDVRVHGEDPLPADVVARAAAVLFIGGDQSLMAGAVADPAYAAAVRQAVQRPTPVMTDGAATAVLGERYVTDVDPTTADEAIEEFRVDGSEFADGLGVVRGWSVEPVLTYDYRWGRLYGAAHERPDTAVLGISELTAVRVDRGGATVVGERSAIAVDGSQATWAVGSNGALAAVNVWMDVLAAGDRLG